MKKDKTLLGILFIYIITNTICLADFKDISKKVNIIVKFNKQEGFIYYYFDNFQYFRSQSTPRKIIKYKNESIRNFTIDVINPIFMNFVNGNYRSMVYVEPGDTIEVICSSNSPLKILQNRQYKQEQMFINELSSRGLDILNQDLSFAELDSKINPKYLLEELDGLYTKRLMLLNKFADSLGFCNKYTDCLAIDFKLLNLITTLRIYANLPEINKAASLFKPRIDSLSQELFFNKATSCNWYLETLYAFYHYKRNQNNILSNKNKASIYYDTKKYLPSKQSEIIQNFLIKWNCECFGEKNVKNWINDFKKTCTQKELLISLEKHLYEKNKTSLSLNKKFQQQVLKATNGKKIMWHNILNNNKIIKYIDVWASWCVPCYLEMPYSIQLRKKIHINKVTFIYISIDKDEKKWLTSIKSNKINMAGAKHYLLDPKSDLAIYLQSEAIPRYILIDREGVIINNNAPKPSSPRVLELLINAAK